MRARRRTNLLWGLVLLVGALVILLNTLQQLPAPVFDLFARAWPALLILAGLSIVLRPRVPLGAGIALVLSVALVAVVAVFAFSTRATQQRSDYRAPIEQPIGSDVTLLSLHIETLATDVELLRSVGVDRVIGGEFVGSTESTLSVVYEETAVAASLRVVEQQANQLPMLENMGRGTLQIELPADVPLDVVLAVGDGNVTLNTDGLAIERLNLDLGRGDALVTLPAYQPLGSERGTTLGELAARDGDMTLVIDPAIATRLELNRGGSGIDPVFDPQRYNYLVGDVLEARDIEAAEIVVQYTVTVPRGQIIIRQPGQGDS